jgi:IS1 family transposase
MPSIPMSQVMVLLFVLLVVWVIWLVDGREIRREWQRLRLKAGEWRRTRRALRPRGADSCERCCAEGERKTCQGKGKVVAWEHYKQQTGRHKAYNSDGEFCPNAACRYYEVSDGPIHAIVHDGWRGKRKDIPYWRCQACGKRFSGRRNTPLYSLKTPETRVAEVLSALAEGVDVAASSRIFRHREKTITGWLERAARHGERLHQAYLRDIVAEHLQLDELVTKVRSHAERVFIWTAVEARTKLLLATHIGRRTQADANALVHGVKATLAATCVPVFTTDGLRQYFYAITAHFGHWTAVAGNRKPVWELAPDLLYGQLRKVRSGFSVKFTYTRMLIGSRDALTERLQVMGLSGAIQTAFVERLNLTLRQMVAPLIRRTWSLAHSEASLARYLEWARTYYHFIRYHDALRVQFPTSTRYRSRTPMMAAGLTTKRWSVEDFLRLPLPATLI